MLASRQMSLKIKKSIEITENLHHIQLNKMKVIFRIHHIRKNFIEIQIAFGPQKPAPGFDWPKS